MRSVFEEAFAAAGVDEDRVFGAGRRCRKSIRCARATQTELTVSPRPHVSRQARERLPVSEPGSSVISKFQVT